ncbi:MAG: hypothetical protein WCR02_02565 [Sphaerochaetaceae bacterium]
MRSDIINEVLTVEDHAQQIVKDAEMQSHEQIIEAQDKANQLVHDLVQKQRILNRAEMEKAEQSSTVELENYEASLDSVNMMPSEVLDDIAQKIVLLVSKSALFGDKR